MCPALLTGSSRLVNWKRPDLKLRKDLDVPDVEEERTLMCKALLTGSLPPATWNRPNLARTCQTPMMCSVCT
jgi:hypothetical protein